MHSRSPLGLIASACVLLLIVCTAQAEEPLNLLFFGNSFTNHLEVFNRVKNLATADGHPTPVTVFSFGGSYLDEHTESISTRPELNMANTALPNGDAYDFAVIQGHSDEATYLRYLTDTHPTDTPFEDDALALYQAVAHHASGNGNGVTAVMYQTWARPDLVTDGDFDTLEDMQEEIVAGYQAAHNLITATEGTGTSRIATVGQAFELGGFESDLYNVDKYHQSEKGATLAALVIYRTIYEENVSDIAYSQVSGWIDISEADWNDVTAWADAAPIVTPEPTSICIVGIAGLGLIKRRRRA